MDLDVHILESEIDRARLLRAIKSAPLKDQDGQPLVVQLGHAEPLRTPGQNALMWAWHKIVASTTGYSIREVHEFVCQMFLPPKLVEIHGVTKEVRASTSELTVPNMKIYLDQYQAWAHTDLGITLPSGKEAEVWAAIKSAKLRAA